MYKFRDALYLIALLNYHLLNKNSIELKDYSISIEPSDSMYKIDQHYGYESVNYKVTILDKENNVVYRNVYVKTSSSLEYLDTLDEKEMQEYIFSNKYSLNRRKYLIDGYYKMRQLQAKHPVVANEAGLLSEKDPSIKVQLVIYKYLKETLNQLQIDLQEMKKRTR